MQSPYTGTVTCHFAMETKLWLRACTRLKIQLSENTDKVFDHKLQDRKTGTLQRFAKQHGPIKGVKAAYWSMHALKRTWQLLIELVVPRKQEGQKQTHRSTR